MQSNASEVVPAVVLAALRYQARLAEGWFDAFRFALECEGDAVEVKAKIEEIEDRISRRGVAPAFGVWSAAARVYDESYVAGLKEALTIILGRDEYIGGAGGP